MQHHDDKELKIEFAPGCFDGWEGTEEELQELIAEVRQMAANGTLLENSTPVPDDEAEEILQRMAERGQRQ